MQYYMDGMYREAIDEWESVLKIDPDHVDAQVNITHAQRRLADIAEREP
jgi:cytochrome c-type biogenesis protein CcmH/NrfG